MLLIGEQAIDHFFVSVWGLVGEERVLLRDGGRDSDQIEVHAAEQR